MTLHILSITFLFIQLHQHVSHAQYICDLPGPPIVLDFEGAKANYDDTTGTAFDELYGRCGIFFSSSARALIAYDQGGTGDFCSGAINGKTSGKTAMTFFDSSAPAIMSVYAGFDTAFSFYYSSIANDVLITVYDDVEGIGNVLNTVTLQRTPTNPELYGDISYCPFFIGVVGFTGTAYSVSFGGAANGVVFDDITLGDFYPGYTKSPSYAPLPFPVNSPSAKPARSKKPSIQPVTLSPSITMSPSAPTLSPIAKPSKSPRASLTSKPVTIAPSTLPSSKPSGPTADPSSGAPFNGVLRTRPPSGSPTGSPTRPSVPPSGKPFTLTPTARPSLKPTVRSAPPSHLPSLGTSVPSSGTPSLCPSSPKPTSQPSSSNPTIAPTAYCSNSAKWRICTNCTVLTINAIIVLENLAFSLLTDEFPSIICAVRLSIGLAIPLNVIVTGTSVLPQPVLAGASMVDVRLSISSAKAIEKDAFEVYTSLTNSLTTAVTRGQFLTFLQSASHDVYLHSLDSARVHSLIFDPFTRLPSCAPTVAANVAINSAQSKSVSSADSFDFVTLVTLVATVSAVCCLGVVAWSLYMRYRRSIATEKVTRIETSHGCTDKGGIAPREGDLIEISAAGTNRLSIRTNKNKDISSAMTDFMT